MADRTEIAWCDSTFNPWIGCTKVGPGCDNCYAEADFDHRKHRVKWGAGQERSRTSVANWKKPLQWNRADFRACDCGWRGEIDTLESDECPACGRHEKLEPARRRVFCASLADVFDNEVQREWRYDLLWLISNTQNLDWMLLTKRIGNAQRMLEDECGRMGFPWPEKWPNVWIGATICNQAEADRDIPKLLTVPARVRFLSMEPLLGLVDLTQIAHPHGIAPSDTFDCTAPWGTREQIDWVIVGGESGPNARPMHPDWARDLRDQCAAAGVPFLFKQWGEFSGASGIVAKQRQWVMMDEAGRTLLEAGSTVNMGPIMHVARIGKKAAGRLLDGVQHDGFPGGAA